MQPSLILASTSSYRKTLLEKLGQPFHCAAPQVDETARHGETAEALVSRLAFAKANAVAADRDQGLIIGTAEKAVEQLLQAQGKRVIFYTGLCVINAANGHAEQLVEPFTVHFRSLDEAAIRRYVEAERPLDCAGSFKCEGMGIVLFKALEGRDPNALVGLPLIGLVDLLGRHGLALP